jgi:threonine dehydrogenase-like Zn-dependent dehydrogenase
MKAGVFYGPLDIRVEEVADPIIQVSTDAVVKITYTCICGSDLWWYRGITKRDTGGQIGHEFMGEVIKVGNEVKNVKIGDMVVGPFFWCDGTCPLLMVAAGEQTEPEAARQNNYEFRLLMQISLRFQKEQMKNYCLLF